MVYGAGLTPPAECLRQSPLQLAEWRCSKIWRLKRHGTFAVLIYNGQDKKCSFLRGHVTESRLRSLLDCAL